MGVRQFDLRARASLAVVLVLFGAAGVLASISGSPAFSQKPPNRTEIHAYKGLFAAAIRGDVAGVKRELAAGAAVNARDDHGRTPLHIAAHRGEQAVARALVAGGADANAKDSQAYDIITIAAVRDDVDFLKLALELGGDPKAITSPYKGTALIAAAHLGHDGVVRTLIEAGAPLDHVNNLGWTALIEAIVLGDGGKRHQACVKALLTAGADPNLADGSGVSPLALARRQGYEEMAQMIAQAGGR